MDGAVLRRKRRRRIRGVPTTRPRIMAVQTTVRKRVSSHDVPHPIQRAFTPRRPWRSTTPSCGSVNCRRTCRSASRSRARPTRRSCGSRMPPAAASPTSRRTCAASHCGSRSTSGTSIDLLATNFRCHTPATPASSWSSPRPPRVARSHRLLGLARLVQTVRNLRDRAHAEQRPNRPQAAGGQRRDPDVLEPRSVDVGPGSWRCAICCGRRRVRRRRPNRRRPTRAICPPRRPGAWVRATSASSCASSATSTTR